jgi:hypothetical protein
LDPRAEAVPLGRVTDGGCVFFIRQGRNHPIRAKTIGKICGIFRAITFDQDHAQCDQHLSLNLKKYFIHSLEIVEKLESIFLIQMKFHREIQRVIAHYLRSA